MNDYNSLARYEKNSLHFFTTNKQDISYEKIKASKVLTSLI